MRITRPLSFVIKQATKTLLRKTAVGTLSITMLVAGVIVGQNLLFTPSSASAITPSDSCFYFFSGTIYDYYDNENGDPGQPSCTKDLDIPNTIGGEVVTSIGDYAFLNSQLTSVTIPSSVTSIGQHGFNQNQLTSVTIPNSVTSIGYGAFYSNRLLTSVTIPNSVTSIGGIAFAQNQLTSVTIPNSVTSIGDSAFYGNLLTSVTIPNSVTSIGDFAFSDNQLTSAVFEGNVTSLGVDIFATNPLISITYNGAAYTTSAPLAEECFDFSLGSINGYYQYDMNLIKNSGIACMKKDVTIPSTVGGISVTAIGDEAFQDKGLTSVTIPSSITTIGDYALAFNQLTSVTIPTSVTDIDDGAFYKNQINSLTISSFVTSIGELAFGQNQLSLVTLPDALTNLGNYAFAYNHIEQVILPNTLTGLSTNTFAYQSTMTNWQVFDDLLYDGTPTEVQQTVASIFYTRVYTANSSNPAGLQDGIHLEGIELDGDNDWNDVVILGGHLINPASATLSFTNPDGSELQPSQTLTGKLEDGTNLTNYFASQGPTLPDPVDPYSPTPAETQAIRDALQAYYRVGDTFTYAAPVINGITPTPASYSFVLGASTNVNNKAFVYGATDSSAANGGQLANTGLSLYTILVLAGAVTLVSGISAVRYLKTTK